MKQFTPKKIFFIRSDRLGEFLLSLPAIKLVKLNYPKSKIYLLSQRNNIDLIKGVDFIDAYIDYEENLFKGYRGAHRLAAVLRKEKIDCVIALNPKKEFHLAALLAGVPLRLGYNRKWGFCLNRKIEDKKHLAQKHEVEYNLDLVNLVCKDAHALSFELVTAQAQTLHVIEEHLSLSQKYIVIHPFSSNPLKKAGETFWQKLVTALKDKCGENIVLIGGSEERHESEKLAKKLGVQNITGILPLWNLAYFLKHSCVLFIGLDSGPMHLASLLRLPVVALFKTSNAKRWGPFNTKSLVIEAKDCAQFLAKIEDILEFACLNTRGK